MTLAGSADEISNMTAVQQMFAAVGVKLRIDQVDNATRNARYKAGDFQMRNALWTDDLADPSEIGSYILYSPTIQSLHSGWQSEAADKLFLASQEEIDPAKRKADYKQMQDIYKAAAPMIFLYESPYPVAFNKRRKGSCRSRWATTTLTRPMSRHDARHDPSSPSSGRRRGGGRTEGDAVGLAGGAGSAGRADVVAHRAGGVPAGPRAAGQCSDGHAWGPCE